ncbi:hypothetical protein L1987_33756 [Smallanthus sonchifolius]|uniref:Uncharacterized protein n=1 Tax=Smallanthus sonchifolius TaxID=185202 RepID=A0ACB9HRQ6_9ASTR|nr:hypothetical protein L1987_33756 [Smallanthus sonchifolius]
MDIQKCSAYTYVEGTPYLIDGCEFTEECTRCRNSGGFCDDGAVYDVDGLVTKWNFTCGFDTPYNDNVIEIKSSKSSLGVILGVSISMGVVFLVKSNTNLDEIEALAKELLIVDPLHLIIVGPNVMVGLRSRRDRDDYTASETRSVVLRGGLKERQSLFIDLKPQDDKDNQKKSDPKPTLRWHKGENDDQDTGFNGDQVNEENYFDADENDDNIRSEGL